MIAIIDYNAGNLRSIVKAVELYSKDVVVTDNPETILSADKIILPGVGNFESAMENLSKEVNGSSLKEAICGIVKEVPFLGICLGMQLLMEKSEEGNGAKGLGIIKGDVIKFKDTVEKIPHMGWNIIYNQKESKLFTPTDDEERFYFVHSYYVSCNNREDILTTTSYGHNFVSSFEKENIVGVQFHPESIMSEYGHEIIGNFLNL